MSRDGPLRPSTSSPAATAEHGEAAPAGHRARARTALLLSSVGRRGLVREGVLSLVDTEGRPLDETANRAERKGIELRLERCPYSDSRLGAPMNVSALHQIGRYWQPTLDVLAYLAETARDGEGSITRFYRAVSTAVSAPMIAALSRGVEQGPVPVVVACAYKVALGFRALARQVIGEAIHGRSDALPGLAELYQLAERRRLLHGSAEVCAASPAWIQAAADALRGGRTLGQQARAEVATLLGSCALSSDKLARAATPIANHLLFDFAFHQLAKGISSWAGSAKVEGRVLVRELQRVAAVALIDPHASATFEALRELLEAGGWSAPEDRAAAFERLEALAQATFRASERQLRDAVDLAPPGPECTDYPSFFPQLFDHKSASFSSVYPWN